MTTRNDAGAKVKTATQDTRSKESDVEKPPYDPETFGKYLRTMKGTKSCREFAIETDLSESFISKAVSGLQKGRPSRRTVLKLMRSRTEKPIDRRELARVAGLDYLDLEADLYEDNPADARPLSAAAVITRYYGEDPYTAMSELQRALSEHVIEGDIASYYYRRSGYFEIRDILTGQVYAGINAYVRPIRHSGDEDRTQAEIEENAVTSIAFSAGLTYNNVTASDDASNKIVYILTDNESVFEGCRHGLTESKTKATVILMTDDHQGFRKEAVLDGSDERLLSLVD